MFVTLFNWYNPVNKLRARYLNINKPKIIKLIFRKLPIKSNNVLLSPIKLCIEKIAALLCCSNKYKYAKVILRLSVNSRFPTSNGLLTKKESFRLLTVTKS